MYRVIKPKSENSTAPGVTANHDTSVVKSAVTVIADAMLGDKDAVQLVARSNEDGLETARTRACWAGSPTPRSFTAHGDEVIGNITVHLQNRTLEIRLSHDRL